MSLTTQDIVYEALKEDIPDRDLTTEAMQMEQHPWVQGRIVAKEDLVLSGREVAEEVFLQVSPKIKHQWYFEDGQFIYNQQTICSIEGPADLILQAERVALNFLGKLSGIATLTKCFVSRLEGLDCRILDTRKTTPLYRSLEKKAVRDGGGSNHRLHLSDQILIKENHIRMVGDFKESLLRAKDSDLGPIRVECQNSEEVALAVKAGVSAILLDNMTNEELKSCVALIPKNIETEASGNMNIDRVRSVAELGINAISVGSITHSAPSADLSLLIDEMAKNGDR